MRQQFRLINQTHVKRGCGDEITLGTCPACGKNVKLSSANKTGSRCRNCGTQFDKNGNAEGDPDFGR